MKRSFGVAAALVAATLAVGTGATTIASGRLVAVRDATPFGGNAFRVEVDDTFTRFFNVNPGTSSSSWIATL